jgi:hypothetical protein
MDPYEFEELVAALWAHYGYETQVRKGSGDRGIDIEATKRIPYQQKDLIQAKRYADDNTIGSQTIREYATLKRQDPDADIVVLVTTSGFTSQAARLAQDLGVKTVDGETLSGLIAANLPQFEDYIPPEEDAETPEEEFRQSLEIIQEPFRDRLLQKLDQLRDNADEYSTEGALEFVLTTADKERHQFRFRYVMVADTHLSFALEHPIVHILLESSEFSAKEIPGLKKTEFKSGGIVVLSGAKQDYDIEIRGISFLIHHLVSNPSEEIELGIEYICQPSQESSSLDKKNTDNSSEENDVEKSFNDTALADQENRIEKRFNEISQRYDDGELEL